jgi:hypothetical protein
VRAQDKSGGTEGAPVKVTPIYKLGLEVIARSLRAEGVIDAALREYARHEPHAERMEVFV